MKVLIVGGCGFFGSKLAAKLSEAQHDITIADIKEPWEKNFVLLDLTSPNLERQLDELLNDIDYVVNCAVIQIPRINQQPWRAYATNISGLQKLCQCVETSKKCKGLLHISTWEVTEEKTEERNKLYKHTKILQEKVIEWYQMVSAKRYGIVRIGTLLGEGMNPNTAAHIFINNALHGKPITPYAHSLSRQIHYIDIEDACQHIIKYLDHMAKGTNPPTVTFTNPTPLTIMELAELVKAHTGAPIQIVNTENKSDGYTPIAKTIGRLVNKMRAT